MRRCFSKDSQIVIGRGSEALESRYFQIERDIQEIESKILRRLSTPKKWNFRSFGLIGLSPTSVPPSHLTTLNLHRCRHRKSQPVK